MTLGLVGMVGVGDDQGILQVGRIAMDPAAVRAFDAVHAAFVVDGENQACFSPVYLLRILMMTRTVVELCPDRVVALARQEFG